MVINHSNGGISSKTKGGREKKGQAGIEEQRMFDEMKRNKISLPPCFLFIPCDIGLVRLKSFRGEGKGTRPSEGGV